MAFKKITSGDLAGKGVIGMADVPGLTATEMQEKVEEIVRDVVIPNINDNIDEIGESLATKEELAEAVFHSGSVSSVFGRTGAVTAQSGDYTAAMVGAAAAAHKNQHKSDCADPITPDDIGAANGIHAHGNITAEGKIGSTNGLCVMTGAGGALVAKAKNETGFVQIAQVRTGSGAVTVTLEDNCEYDLTGVTALTLTDAAVTCHGFIKFGNSPTAAFVIPTVEGEPVGRVTGDDISEAASNEFWEFDVLKGNAIFKNWGDGN